MKVGSQVFCNAFPEFQIYIFPHMYVDHHLSDYMMIICSGLEMSGKCSLITLSKIVRWHLKMLDLQINHVNRETWVSQQ